MCEYKSFAHILLSHVRKRVLCIVSQLHPPGEQVYTHAGSIKTIITQTNGYIRYLSKTLFTHAVGDSLENY